MDDEIRWALDGQPQITFSADLLQERTSEENAVSSYEPALLRLLASDLRTYFSLFKQTYEEQLLAFALRLAGGQDDAHDIVENAFGSAYETLAARSAQQVENTDLWPLLRQMAGFCYLKRKAKVGWEKFRHAAMYSMKKPSKTA